MLYNNVAIPLLGVRRAYPGGARQAGCSFLIARPTMGAGVLNTERASEILRQQVADRQRAEKRQSALLRIATQATSAVDLQQLYAGIHRIVAELMYAEN